MSRTTQCPLTPALLELLEACVVLRTTRTNPLAAHLHRSPATIRTEFQRILNAFHVDCRYAALKKAEECGCLKTRMREIPCTAE